jgi:hypothetical protein
MAVEMTYGGVALARCAKLPRSDSTAPARERSPIARPPWILRWITLTDYNRGSGLTQLTHIGIAMSQFVLDEAETARVDGLKSPIQVCDASGNLIGYLVSKEKFERLVYAWAKQEVSEEHLRRVASEPEGYSLQEILDRLPKS